MTKLTLLIFSIALLTQRETTKTPIQNMKKKKTDVITLNVLPEDINEYLDLEAEVGVYEELKKKKRPSSIYNKPSSSYSSPRLDLIPNLLET